MFKMESFQMYSLFCKPRDWFKHMWCSQLEKVVMSIILYNKRLRKNLNPSHWKSSNGIPLFLKVSRINATFLMNTNTHLARAWFVDPTYFTQVMKVPPVEYDRNSGTWCPITKAKPNRTNISNIILTKQMKVVLLEYYRNSSTSCPFRNSKPKRSNITGIFREMLPFWLSGSMVFCL